MARNPGETDSRLICGGNQAAPRSAIVAMIMAIMVMIMMADADTDATDMHADDGGAGAGGAQKSQGDNRCDQGFHGISFREGMPAQRQGSPSDKPQGRAMFPAVHIDTGVKAR